MGLRGGRFAWRWTDGHWLCRAAHRRFHQRQSLGLDGVIGPRASSALLKAVGACRPERAGCARSNDSVVAWRTDAQEVPEARRLAMPRAGTYKSRMLLHKDVVDVEWAGSPAGLALVPTSTKHIGIEIAGFNRGLGRRGARLFRVGHRQPAPSTAAFIRARASGLSQSASPSRRPSSRPCASIRIEVGRTETSSAPRTFLPLSK